MLPVTPDEDRMDHSPKDEASTAPRFSTPAVQALARKDLEARVTKLLGEFRIPQETTDIIVALVRQAMQ